MTAITAPTAGPAAAPAVRPVRWLRLAWVGWRQHRLALGGAAALLAGICVWMLVSGLQMRSALNSFGLNNCTPLTASSCSSQETVFINDYYSGAQVVVGVLTVVPILIGALVGGPLVARELETGTFRLSWTQGCGRTRWLVSRLALLAVAVTAGAAAVSVLFSWYYQPMLRLGQDSRLTPQIFDLSGVAFAGWTLAAFAISVCAGALIRRMIPAIVAALAAWSGLLVAVVFYLRSHYLAPLTGTGLINSTSGTGQGAPWLLTQWWIQPGGAPASQSEIATLSVQLRQAGGLPTAQAVQQWFAEQGYIKYFTYQPASRFWNFQLIEGSWLLVLSLLLGAATVWLIRHRAT
jgi:ABC-type transport system involved in multi-copper enzyme maturation permease subunit